MKLREFQTDTEREEKGVWIHPADDFKINLSAWGNSRFLSLKAELLKKYKQRINTQSMTDDEYEKEIDNVLIARTIVNGWEGNLEDETGANITYSAEKCLEMLNDAKYRRVFREYVVMMAKNVNLFQPEDLATDSKNSGGTSGGKQSTQPTSKI